MIGPRPKPKHEPIDPELLKPSGALAYLSMQKGYGRPARLRKSNGPLRKAE